MKSLEVRRKMRGVRSLRIRKNIPVWSRGSRESRAGKLQRGQSLACEMRSLQVRGLDKSSVVRLIKVKGDH